MTQPTNLARPKDTVNLDESPVVKTLGWGLVIFAVGGAVYSWYKRQQLQKMM
jgi:hypothetical protein